MDDHMCHHGGHHGGHHSGHRCGHPSLMTRVKLIWATSMLITSNGNRANIHQDRISIKCPTHNHIYSDDGCGPGYL